MSTIFDIDKEQYQKYLEIINATHLYNASEDEFYRKTKFCEQILGTRKEFFLNLIQNIIFTDETIFCLSSTVYSQNCRYWVTEISSGKHLTSTEN